MCTKRVDLHIHTNASSDGQYTPEEIFQMSKEKDLVAISFADHNSVASVQEGLRLSKQYGIELIPAVEINTMYKGCDFHLLAYFIDINDGVLNRWMKEILERQKRQAFGRYTKLKEIGFVLNYEDIEYLSNGKIPTGVSYLKAILLHEENKSDPRVKRYIEGGDRADSPYLNFYLDFLRLGQPAAYPVDMDETPIAIEKILNMKAIPILAHPGNIKTQILMDFIEAGLMGLEVYTSYHDDTLTAKHLHFARQNKLLITAGSDFHGELIKPHVSLGSIKNNGYEIVLSLKRAKERLAGKCVTAISP